MGLILLPQAIIPPGWAQCRGQVIPAALSCHNCAVFIAWLARPQKNSVPNPHTADASGGQAYVEPNAENHYEVTRADLPLHCPLDGMSL